MKRLIKRYGNRKLYDTRESRYVTLEEIERLVRAEVDLKIVDNETGEDLTALTLAQVILEQERRQAGVLSLPVLRSIIRHGGAAWQDLISRVDKGIEGLVGRGGSARNAGRRLWDDLLQEPQRRLEQLQRRIDEGVKGPLERLAGHPAIRKEVQRIEESLRRIEVRLGRLRRDRPGPPPSERKN